MHNAIERVNIALEDLRNGKMVILTDDPERENEGDLIAAAENMTTAMMNLMIRSGSGIVCLSLLPSQLKKLDLPLMLAETENTSARGTPFTLPIDAKEGITTGVSAADRIKTIQVAIADNTKPEDLVKPGHLFPLQAKEGGVLERQGHTEGALDLARLAGLKPAAVLCEVMNPDGTMARGKQLVDFAHEHHLNMLSIADIIAYRVQHENLLQSNETTTLPLDDYGTFNITVFKDITGAEHVVLSKDFKLQQPVLVRIHSSCLTGDLFGSRRCDCHQQLHYSLEKISREGGMLIYLHQEGRGIGLLNKIKAYALQEQGLDTVEANEKLGLAVDARQYYMAANILRHFNIAQVRLLTNNPNKLSQLQQTGIDVSVESLPSFHHEHNLFYLQTKKEKLNHAIDFDKVSS